MVKMFQMAFINECKIVIIDNLLLYKEELNIYGLVVI